MRLPECRELVLALSLTAGLTGCEMTIQQDAEAQEGSEGLEGSGEDAPYTAITAITDCHAQSLRVQNALNVTGAEINRVIAEIQNVYTQRPEICTTFDSEYYSCNQELTTSVLFDPAPLPEYELLTVDQSWNHCSITMDYYVSNLINLESNLRKAEDDLQLIIGIKQNLDENNSTPQPSLATPQSGSTVEGSN